MTALSDEQAAYFEKLMAMAVDPEFPSSEFYALMFEARRKKQFPPGTLSDVWRARSRLAEEQKRAAKKEKRRNRCDFALGSVVAPRDRDISRDDYTPTELMNFREGESAVYFLAAPLANAIKIGVALDINKRLPDIAVQSPIPVIFIGACAGDAEYERRLHRNFSDLRIHGEWFRDTPELHSFIQSAVEANPHRTMAEAHRLAERAARVAAI